MSEMNDKVEEKKPKNSIVVILSYVVSFIASLFYALILFVVEIIAKLLGIKWPMDKVEAKNLIQKELKNYRGKPYSELINLIDKPQIYEITGARGDEYQVEIGALWDDKKKKTLRVLGSIDNGKGWSAYSPLNESFIISPANEISKRF